jgi:hypothetical protein
MSNCDNELSSQIKALHARIDRAENHLLAHTAQSIHDALAMIGAFDPIMQARGALKLAESSAYDALIALVDNLPGVSTFRQLMHLDSARLVDALGDTLAKTISGMADLAVKRLESAIDAQIAAYRDYIIAVEGQAVDAVVQPLLNTLNQATAILNQANATINLIKNFIKTLADISSCQCEAAVIKSPTATAASAVQKLAANF